MIIPAPEKLDSFATVPDVAMNNIAEAVKDNVDISRTSAHIPNADNGLPSTDELKPNISVDKSIKGTPTKLGTLVGGELAINLIDLAVPTMIVIAVRYVGYKIEKGRLQLNKKDKEVVQPAMQAALDAIDINFDNPFVNLAVVLSVVYGIKIVEEIPDIEKFTKPAKKLKPPEQVVYPLDKRTMVDVEDKEPEPEPTPDIAPSVYQNMPKVDTAKTDFQFSNETKFKDEFNAIIAKIMKSGKRKSKVGAIGFLRKEEPDVIKELLRKYGMNDLPDEFKNL